MIKIYKNTKLRKRNTIKIAAYDQFVGLLMQKKAAKAGHEVELVKYNVDLEQYGKDLLPNKQNPS